MFRTTLTTMFMTSAVFAETHVIQCIGMSFVPNVVDAVPGDVIRWEYVNGLPHTATSGSPCLYDGLFHGSVASFNPVYEWQVPNDVPEEIPFFCIPHCEEGMTGIIYVSQGGTTWTVDDDGKADFNNIQAAVDAASNGDEIVVMPGTYIADTPLSFGGSDQYNNVVDMLGKVLWLHSSDGAGTTIIDGEDKRRGIICRSGETAKTIIEGFTIKNCRSPWYDWNGNGQVDYWEYFGGGMWNRDGSNPTVASCNFMENTSEYGGGMYNGDENIVQSNPTIIGCVFQENFAGFGFDSGVGGGMYNFTSSPTISSCEFIGNSAFYGGGMLNWESSNPLLTDCSFTGNNSGGDGGGLYNSQSMPIFEDCVFYGNNAHDGGGVFNADPSSSINVPVFQNCTFSANSAYAEGGGMHNFSISPVLIQCTFEGNTASAGGAILSWNSSLPSILDSLICGNMPNQISGPWADKGGNEIVDECPSNCPDVNDDGVVGVTDILAIIDQWGLTDSPADVSGDGIVDVTDLLMVVGNWGPCN